LKLNKAGLITMIDAIEVNVKAQQKEYDAALVKHKVTEEVTWKANQLPKYKVLRDFLTQKLKTKSTITADEIRELGFRDRYGSNEFNWFSSSISRRFEIDGKSYDGYPVMPTALGNLRAALSVIEDAEVSTSALANLGFRNLEWFFTRAARAEAGI